MKCLSEESGLEVGFIKTLFTMQRFTLSCYIKKDIYIYIYIYIYIFIYLYPSDLEKVMSYYIAKKKRKKIQMHPAYYT